MSGFFKLLLLLPIYAYRLLISPFTPPSCRFQPVCSAYALAAIKRHGAWVGGILAVRRLAACHPFTRLGARQGYDPVPLAIQPIAWYAPWKIISADKTIAADEGMETD